jgi:hypothetical protein
MIAVLPEMKFSVKQFKEMLKIAENLYGINNENVISLRAFTTEKEAILQKTQTQGFITKRDFHSFFDSDRLKKIGHRFNSEMQQAGINGMAERAVERRAGSRACRRRRWERSEHP